jgi:hypothetical protein
MIYDLKTEVAIRYEIFHEDFMPFSDPRHIVRTENAALSMAAEKITKSYTAKSEGSVKHCRTPLHQPFAAFPHSEGWHD